MAYWADPRLGTPDRSVPMWPPRSAWGIGTHVGPVLSPFMGSMIGSAFGAPTVGWAIGTGMGFAESGLIDNFKSHWEKGLGKGTYPGFAGTAVLGSTAASLLGADPTSSLIMGLGGAAGVSTYDWAAGKFGSAPGTAASALLRGAAFSPIGTVAAGAFLRSDLDPRRFIENVGPNVLPGAVMLGGALGVGLTTGVLPSKGISKLAGNKWGRLGMLGAAVAASQDPGFTGTAIGLGAAGSLLYAGGTTGAMAAGERAISAGGRMASAFFKHPYAIGALAGAVIGGVSGLTGMSSRGAEDELINDQFGTFTMRQAGMSGMGGNYLDAAGVSLAAHYNSKTFSRG